MKTNCKIIRAALALALTTCALTLAPSLARADSIVYVKDANVWLSAPDGSRQTAVTTDGSPASPYLAPSQADDGTIAAAHGNRIVLLRQNGEVIRELDPPPLTDSTSHPVDGVPVFVAISPDASKVAYGFAGYGCPVWTECMARATTSVTDADRVVPPSTYGQVTYGDPHWVTASRLMVFGGYLSQINLWDLGQRDRFHWFDDEDWAGSESSTDLGDGDLSRDNRLWVGIRGYENEAAGRFPRLIWFRTSGNPATDTPPPVPASICATEEVPGLSGPTVAPSGDAFAFQTPQGVHVFRGVYTDPSRCGEAQENLVLPGASEPDWGPADVNPQPRAGGPPAGAPSGMPAGGKKGATGSPRISIPRASLATACRKGLRVALANVRSRKATIVVRRGGATVAKATVRVPKSGRGTFTVRFSKRAAKNPCKRPPRTVKLTVTAAGVEKAVTLAR